MKTPKTTDIVNTKFLYEYNNEEFLEKAYQLLLNRQIDDGGRDYYLKKMRKSTKTEIISEIIRSDEFKKLNKDTQLHYLHYLVSLITFEKSILGSSFDTLAQNYKILRIVRKEIRNLVRKKEKLLERPHDTKIDLEFIRKNLFNNNVTQITPSNNEPNTQNLYVKELINKIYALENNILASQKKSENPSFDKTIYINLTTTRRWRSRAVGIVRTERELAKYLFNNFSNIHYVTWLPAKNNFYELPLSYVKGLLEDSWTDASKTVLNLDDDYLTDKISIQSSDVFISLGLDWDNELTSEIYKLKVATGCKVVLGCHDLIPILYPEHTVDASFKQLFKKHYIDMLYTADIVWTNSENSKTDLIDFWQQSKTLCSKLPKVEIIHLGSDIKDTNTNNVMLLSKPIKKFFAEDKKFILYVSSIEARKNHNLLLNLWREGYSEYGEDFPTLVLVGRKGWGVTNLLEHMHRMPAYLNKNIVWFDDVSDDELSEFYRQCLFSVFPSIYEGWGLGAAESLTFGKACVVSNNSSLQEATQYLMPTAHPLDFLAWKSMLEKLIFDGNSLIELNNSIKKSYIPRTWQDFSLDFLKTLESLNMNNLSNN